MTEIRGQTSVLFVVLFEHQEKKNLNLELVFPQILVFF